MLFLYMDIITDDEDRDFFDIIYNEYAKLCLKIADDIVHDHHAAEDIVQDTFIRAAKNIKKISKNDSKDCHKTKNFLVTICRNVSIDYYNKRKNIAEQEFDEAYINNVSDTYDNTKAEDSVVIRAIQQLDKIYSDTLKLRYVYDMPDKEIAKSMEISEANVRKRISRGK